MPQDPFKLPQGKDQLTLISKKPLRTSKTENGSLSVTSAALVAALCSSRANFPPHTLQLIGFRSGDASTMPMQSSRTALSSSMVMSRGRAVVVGRRECSWAE
jgi:hypothetical protein